MRKSILILIVFLIGVSTCVAQDTSSVEVVNNRQKIKLKLDPIEELNIQQVRTLDNKSNYSLYEKIKNDDPTKRGWKKIGSVVTVDDCRENFGCYRPLLQLSSPLEFGKEYLLQVKGLNYSGKRNLEVGFSIKSELKIVSTLDNSRKKLLVKGTDIPAVSKKEITVSKTEYELSEKKDKLIRKTTPVKAEVTQVVGSDTDLELKLNEKLKKGKTTSLKFELEDKSSSNRKAQGKIKIDGIRKSVNESPVDLQLKWITAVNQFPLLDLVGEFKTPKNIEIPGLWELAPSLSIDVGFFNANKNKNSIIAKAPFIYAVARNEGIQHLPLLGDKKCTTNKRVSDLDLNQNEIAKLEAYYNLMNKPWYCLESIEFKIGPKLEADRKFKRINLLGEFRVDFLFNQWISTISKQQKNFKISEAPTLKELEIDSSEVVFDFGYKFVPFFALDFGRKLTNETILSEDELITQTIPRHNIFRTTVGFINEFEWKIFSYPVKLTITENFFHLGTQEIIGTQQKTFVDIRRVRGFQHNNKTTFDVFLEPSKRLTLNFTYENGRFAPNFEYLNKLTTGLRFIY